jgi:NADH:ubiquinone oxidoreductase subunit E
MDNNKPIDVVICLGSSCFARGNGENVRDLKTYLQHYNVAVNFRTRGKLCENKCTLGPVIAINSIEYDHVQPGTAVALLEQALQGRGRKC